MSEPQPAPVVSQPPAEDAAEDSAARAERHMRTLKRLTEWGMDIVEATPAEQTTVSAEVYAKVSRSIRLNILLEAKISAGQDARRAGAVPHAEPAPIRAKTKNLAPELDKGLGEAPYPELHSGAKGLARQLTIEVLDREIPDPEEWDNAVEALDERLLFDAAYDAVDGVPLRDIVERLCADLDIQPDWSLWTGEGWVKDPPLQRKRQTLFPASSRRPCLGAEPDPDPHPDRRE